MTTIRPPWTYAMSFKLKNRPGRQRTEAPKMSSGMASAPQPLSGSFATEQMNPSRASSVWKCAVVHRTHSIDGPPEGIFLMCVIS